MGHHTQDQMLLCSNELFVVQGGKRAHVVCGQRWNAPRCAKAALNQNNFETDQMKTVVIFGFLGVLILCALIILTWAALGFTSA